MINNLFNILYIYNGFQFILFCLFYVYYYKFLKLGIIISVAKSSGTMIGLNVAFLYLTSIKYIKKYIYMPIKYKPLHYNIYIILCIFSILHTCMHFVNFTKLNINWIFLNVNIYGYVLLINIFLFYIFSVKWVREKYFNIFYTIHILLCILFNIFLYLHMSTCFLQKFFKVNKCELLISQISIIPFVLIYYIEFVIKYFCIVKKYYINYYCDVIEIKIYNQKCEYTNNDSYLVWICCPEISLIEWHPFCVSYIKENYYYIHIKNRGDWTNKLYFKKINKLLVYGPFYHHKVYENDENIFISSGIGFTSNIRFISNEKNKFIIIVKNYKDILWCIDSIKNNKNMIIIFTRFECNEYDILKKLEYIQTNNMIYYNKLKINDILNIIYVLYTSNKYIYFSGNYQVYREIKKNIKNYKNFILQE